MEVEPTSLPFSRLSPTLCVFKLVSLSIYLCTTDNSGARVESQQGNPPVGAREQSRHGRRRRRKESEILRGQEERKGEAVEREEEASRRE